MYFTFTGKKEILIEANCPAGKVSQAIRDNIENKDDGNKCLLHIVFSIIPLIRSFAFNIKINKCMDEIEYIVDKVNLE